jgi:DNA/RNA endonuclease YhcR with UshA esterase domain
MKTLVLAFGFVIVAAPAFAQAIAPADAKAQVGKTVTVEGMVDNVHTTAAGNTYIDMAGHYPNNTFAAVIFAADTSKFSNVTALKGKTVDITGPVKLYKDKPEIILKSADQLKPKQ